MAAAEVAAASSGDSGSSQLTHQAVVFSMYYFSRTSADIAAAVVEAGSIPVLVEYVRSSSNSNSSKHRQTLASVLGNLARYAPSSSDGIIAAGGIPALLQFMGKCSSEGERAAASYALTSLCLKSAEPRAALTAAGGISLLVRALHLSSENAQQIAGMLLVSLVNDSESCAEAVTAAGAVPAWCSCWAAAGRKLPLKLPRFCATSPTTATARQSEACL